MKHNFKNLKIWQLALEIACDTYKISAEFPKFEQYGLTNQINRAGVSIASNIAEGSSRGEKHFIHYLNIALGSSFEVHTQMQIAKHNNYVTEQQATDFELKLDELQKMIKGFMSKLDSVNNYGT